MRKFIRLQTLTVFLILSGAAFLSPIGYTGVNDVRQTEIHTAELLLLEPSAFEFELVIEKLKSHKSQGIDQIPAEWIKARVEQFVERYINSLFLLGTRRNCLRSGRSR
jgi:hypothetical protein